ncbi:PIN domain-containing protein [Dysgonomonas sp. GY617]|uniref:PIN domain-containing protein n=1 Tax=Dysgonomonas sp. GY617 TaxID=2780420 RepID=UPI0018844163|nr:PIN domain-containing protein [Dysgonomonas sp. GY617]MBF0578113.1 PIN domain-containing protein [Dysgonomonas sp. GY617]
MSQRYIIDTTTLMSYFASTFEIQSQISSTALNIINEAIEEGTNILLIPSIVFIEIFSKQFITEEKASQIRYEVYEKIKSCENISIEPIDKEVLECFLDIVDIEKGHNFDNHDKIIFATAIKYDSFLITSDKRLIRYNRRKKLIPDIIV